MVDDGRRRAGSSTELEKITAMVPVACQTTLLIRDVEAVHVGGDARVPPSHVGIDVTRHVDGVRDQQRVYSKQVGGLICLRGGRGLVICMDNVVESPW